MITYYYPYIKFERIHLYVKPVLLILILFLVLSFLYDCYGRYSQTYRYKFSFHSTTVEKRNKVTIALFAYLFLIPCYLFRSTFLENAGALTLFADTYLHYEVLISTILLVLAFGAILVHKNKYMYLMFLHKIIGIVFYLSISTTLITRQIDLSYRGNVVCYLLLGTFFYFLNITEIMPDPKAEGNRSDHNYFLPVDRYESLFATRKEQANELTRILRNSSNEPFSICITGDWGTGKTSFVRGTLEKLNRKETRERNIRDNKKNEDKKDSDNKTKREYEIFWINALDLDTTTSLFTYLFAQIKRMLKRRGVYVGIASEYQKFVSAAMGTVTSKNFATLMNEKLFSNAEDYRTQKDRLEDLLSKTLGDDKIVIVVDDIERCDIEKVKPFIFFIKEIATLRNCVSIFITDYHHLPEIYMGESDPNLAPVTKSEEEEQQPKEDHKYLFYEKFFNYRMNLHKVPLLEEMKEFEQEETLDGKLMYEEFHKPIQAYQDIIERFSKAGVDDSDLFIVGFDGKYKEYQEKVEKKKEYRQYQLAMFERLIENPRTLGKFYHVYYNNIKIINYSYNQEFIQEKCEEIHTFFRNIHLSEILFLIALIEVCSPSDFELIKELGLNRYLIERRKCKTNTNVTNLIVNLSTEYFVGKSSESNYIQLKAGKFIDSLIHHPTDLENLVTKCTKQEEEWFQAIETNHMETVIRSWKEVTKAILENYTYGECEEGEDLLRKLFGYVKEQLSNVDNPYQIFEFAKETHLQLTMADNTYFMKCFHKAFCSNPNQREFTNQTIESVISFSSQYMYEFTNHITKFVPLFCDLTNNELPASKVQAIREILLEPKQSLEEKLSNYLIKIGGIMSFNCTGITTNNVYQTLNQLTKYIGKKLNNMQLMQYKDVCLVYQQLTVGNNEVQWFYKILQYLRNHTSCADTNEFDMTDVEKTIMYFEQNLKLGMISGAFMTNLDSFFQKIEFDSNISLNKNQILRLHKVCEIYYNLTLSNTMYYHRILSDYEERNVVLLNAHHFAQ